MWRWWAPGQSRHLQPLMHDAAAYVFRHTGSKCGVQWAILALQDSPDFAAQARHVSEHFEIQAADDAQVELDIQREVWRAEQAPRKKEAFPTQRDETPLMFGEATSHPADVNSCEHG